MLYNIISKMVNMDKKITKKKTRKTTNRNKHPELNNLTKYELEQINGHLRELINVLKDELLWKDQYIRYLKTKAYGMGLFEMWYVQIRCLSDKIKRGWKKLTGKYRD